MADNSIETDIFKKPPLRYLGYANEIGEAFRGIIPNWTVLFSYGIATSYVIAHTFDNILKTQKNGKKYEAVAVGIDTFVWQMLASVIIPGLTINRSCYVMTLCMKQSNIGNQKSKIIVTSLGLLMIPFIIGPIDKSVDYIMNKTIRPSMKKMFPNIEK